MDRTTKRYFCLHTGDEKIFSHHVWKYVYMASFFDGGSTYVEHWDKIAEKE